MAIRELQLEFIDIYVNMLYILYVFVSLGGVKLFSLFYNLAYFSSGLLLYLLN